MYQHDVFICHASEDKSAVVEPIVQACKLRSISCWYDKTNLKWGDDFAKAIGNGMMSSKFVLVVASENAADKGWPLHEIGQAIAREIQKKQTIVLPLFVGDRDRLIEKFPQLSGKLSKKWQNNPDEVAEQISQLLGRSSPITTIDRTKPVTSISGLPYLPSLPKTYTDQDRNRFVGDAFQAVTQYFENASKLYCEQEARITFDCSRIDAQKFALTFYLDGKQKCQCQIWIDKMLSRFPNIHYYEGRDSFSDYSASNEVIGIIETADGLKLKGSLGNFSCDTIDACTIHQASDVLWKRFIRGLK